MSAPSFDYTVIGHVSIDVMDDGTRRAGGTALYSGLQAARLGKRTLIVTQGVEHEIEALIEPYRDELELQVLPAAHTTTLRTSGADASRSQRVLAWAGPIEQPQPLDTAILHLAPIARETPTQWHGRAAFVGLTPQGLVRRWDAATANEISLAATTAEQERLGAACHALVLSQHELTSCQGLIAHAREAGAVVAVTDGERPCTVMPGAGAEIELEVPAIAAAREDLGAGDVFAAAFFVALAEGREPPPAARFAAAAAAVRVQGVGLDAIGARGAIVQRELPGR